MYTYACKFVFFSCNSYHEVLQILKNHFNCVAGNLGDNNGTENMSSRLASVRLEGIVESSHRRKRGMVLPFEPHSLTFDEITYSVDMPQVTDSHTQKL